MLIPLSLSVVVLLAVVGLFMMNRKSTSTSNGQMGSFYGASKTPSGWDQETD